MKIVDYIYYCIYRFVLKTPARSYSDAWPIAFLAFTFVAHVLTAWWLLAIMTGHEFSETIPKTVPVAVRKEIIVVTMVSLMALALWHYAFKGNGKRVIKSFEKLGNERKFARMGAIMFVETLLLPLTLTCLRIFLTWLNK